jgi:transposase
MQTHKHIIQLSKGELDQVQSTIRKGKNNARVITRAQILLFSSRGETKAEIASRLEIGTATVQRIRNQYREGGMNRALYDAPRSGQPQKLNDEGEAYLVALATSNPPEGYSHWTLELLKERVIRAGKAPEDITTVALWKRLDKRHIKPWREKNVVHSNNYTRVH